MGAALERTGPGHAYTEAIPGTPAWERARERGDETRRHVRQMIAEARQRILTTPSAAVRIALQRDSEGGGA